MLSQLKAWYLRTFLPFEDPSHPLHYSHEAALKEQAEQDAIWDELIEDDAPWQLRFTTSSDDHQKTTYL